MVFGIDTFQTRLDLLIADPTKILPKRPSSLTTSGNGTGGR